MFWMRAFPLLGQVGGVGPWNSRVFSALLNGIEPIGECHLGPKNSNSSPPTRPPRFSPSHSPPSSPPPHLELIRNQQQSVRCIKGKGPLWFIKILVMFYVFQKWNCAASLFPKQNYNVLSPKFRIHIQYLWAIYILPGSVLLFCCSQKGRPILKIYKSLTDTWMK